MGIAHEVQSFSTKKR